MKIRSKEFSFRVLDLIFFQIYEVMNFSKNCSYSHRFNQDIFIFSVLIILLRKPRL